MSDGAAGGPSSARLHTLSRSDRSSPGRGGSTDATQTEGASPSTAQLPPTFPPQQEVKPPSLQGGHGRWWSRFHSRLLPSPFPGACWLRSRLVPTRPAPVRCCHLLRESAQRVCAPGHEDDSPLARDEWASCCSAL